MLTAIRTRGLSHTKDIAIRAFECTRSENHTSRPLDLATVVKFGCVFHTDFERLETKIVIYAI